MKRILFLLLFISSIAYADTNSNQSQLLIGDINGTNAGRYRSLKFTNGSTTNNNDGSISVATSGGSGTVTYVSVANANGFSGTVATETTTPAITIIAGDITPNTVNGVTLSGSSTPVLSVSGTASVSGTNTGDQTTISGNAGTAIALAGNGTNCTASHYTLGVDASGNSESCTAAPTECSSSSCSLNASTTLNGNGICAGGISCTSPTFVTPALGAASATSINGLTITSSTGTLTRTQGIINVNGSNIGPKIIRYYNGI